jgi:hypothetical protein
MGGVANKVAYSQLDSSVRKEVGSASGFAGDRRASLGWNRGMTWQLARRQQPVSNSISSMVGTASRDANLKPVGLGNRDGVTPSRLAQYQSVFQGKWVGSGRLSAIPLYRTHSNRYRKPPTKSEASTRGDANMCQR